MTQQEFFDLRDSQIRFERLANAKEWDGFVIIECNNEIEYAIRDGVDITSGTYFFKNRACAESFAAGVSYKSHGTFEHRIEKAVLFEYHLNAWGLKYSHGVDMTGYVLIGFDAKPNSANGLPI